MSSDTYLTIYAPYKESDDESQSGSDAKSVHDQPEEIQAKVEYWRSHPRGYRLSIKVVRRDAFSIGYTLLDPRARTFHMLGVNRKTKKQGERCANIVKREQTRIIDAARAQDWDTIRGIVCIDDHRAAQYQKDAAHFAKR
jgi:hypothetical protein